LVSIVRNYDSSSSLSLEVSLYLFCPTAKSFISFILKSDFGGEFTFCTMKDYAFLEDLSLFFNSLVILPIDLYGDSLFTFGYWKALGLF